MKVQQVVEWLNAIAPFDSAEGFDNVGLLMGDPAGEVSTVLFGMDITEAMADEAIALGAELIVSHHPFIFHALKRIDYTGPQGRVLLKLAQHHISVIAAHTNWDKAPGGISDSLAAVLGLEESMPADEYARIGTLPSPITAEAFALHAGKILRTSVRCYPASTLALTRIAVAGGAYGEGYLAALEAGAQAYLTGEIAHQEILDATARGLTIYDAGHYPTEFPGVSALYQRFIADAAADNWSVKAHLHTSAPYAGVLPAF